LAAGLRRLRLSVQTIDKEGEKAGAMSAEQTTTEPQSQQSDLGEVSHVPAGTNRVSCDGGGAPGDPLGHPQIWLTLTAQPSGAAEATCPYCSHRFIGA